MKNKSEHPDDKIPERLRRDMRELYSPPRGVPLEVDMAIVNGAEKRLSKRKGRRNILRWVATGAAAAVIIMALSVSDLWRSRQESSPVDPAKKTAQFVREDIDCSGRVDILDAFTLAKMVEKGGEMPGDWDMNADGVVNKDDVDSIANTAVKVQKGDRS